MLTFKSGDNILTTVGEDLMCMLLVCCLIINDLFCSGCFFDMYNVYIITLIPTLKSFVQAQPPPPAAPQAKTARQEVRCVPILKMLFTQNFTNFLLLDAGEEVGHTFAPWNL